MMSKSKFLQGTACISLLIFGLTTAGCARSNAGEWKTVIPCGGIQYTVTSHCKASGDSFELNTCRPGQQLATGRRSIEIPSTARASKQAPLFATHWQCVKTDKDSYLLLDYSTGTGRAPSDEAVEFYDSQLNRVTDDSTIRSIYKHADKAPEGYVRSIYPGEGN
jgi:hypothetical protein